MQLYLATHPSTLRAQVLGPLLSRAHACASDYLRGESHVDLTLHSTNGILGLSGDEKHSENSSYSWGLIFVGLK